MPFVVPAAFVELQQLVVHISMHRLACKQTRVSKKPYGPHTSSNRNFQELPFGNRRIARWTIVMGVCTGVFMGGFTDSNPQIKVLLLKNLNRSKIWPNSNLPKSTPPNLFLDTPLEVPISYATLPPPMGGNHYGILNHVSNERWALLQNNNYYNNDTHVHGICHAMAGFL